MTAIVYIAIENTTRLYWNIEQKYYGAIFRAAISDIHGAAPNDH